jgi:hypothetical protein
MRRVLIGVMLGLAVATSASACGFARDADTAASFSPEGEALAAMGFDGQDIAAGEPAFAGAAVAGRAAAAAAPGASASPNGGGGKDAKRKDWRQRRLLRVALAKNTLHGEAVVQTKDGQTVTVVVQRGTITELTDSSVTVKSADGFTLTWRYADNLRVVEKRQTVQPSEVKVGMDVGVAGAKDGASAVARFIVVPVQK